MGVVSETYAGSKSRNADARSHAKPFLTKSLGGLQPGIVEGSDAEGRSEPASKVARVGVAHVRHTWQMRLWSSLCMNQMAFAQASSTR